MSLAAGTRLGPYEVIALLGSGGMGEVYRARDSRLGRDVAIKALPEALAHDPERLSRFEREARLLASLNHPNIAAIYGLEEVGAKKFLVLEYVEGETLAHRLERGALPIDETLQICRDIASGVEAAHEGGVVHRDLKPGNVMLTPAGATKVLDFGLAKSGASSRESGSDPSLSASPTMTYAVTQAGMVLGTAAYMSPEQARGRSVDRRTDIWSFGCVLYECLCGKPVYEGETVSDLVARILEREPDWSALPARTPARVRDLAKRCLVKDAKQRLRDIGDARVELEQVLALASSSGSLPVAEPSSIGAATRAGLRWRSVLAVLAAIAGTVIVMSLLRHDTKIARRFEISAPVPYEMRGDAVECAISPDGRSVAMVLTDSSGTASLWVRAVDSFKPRPLPGTSGASVALQPFWSPDSRSIGFFAGGKLRTIAVAGGDPIAVCEVKASRGGTWNKGGVILFAPTSNGPLYTVPASGGEPKAVTTLDSTRQEGAHRFPRFLPDGRHYLFSVLGKGSGVTIAAAELGKPGHRDVAESQAGGVYAPGGHMILLRNGVLSAQDFDRRSLRLSGPSVSLGDTPQLATSKGAPLVSVADDGTLAYMYVPFPSTQLVWLDTQGHASSIVPLPAATYYLVRLSPDGRTALVGRWTSNTQVDLLAVDVERGTSIRLSNEKQFIQGFAWSPDGSRVAFTASSPQAVYLVPADGSAPPELVLPAGTDFRRLDGFTPDGKSLVIGRQDPQTQWDLWILPLDGDRQPRPYLRGPANETGAAISPDGRWLSYNSDESGRNEGYVQSFPTPGRRYQVTTDGSGVGTWRSDGAALMLMPSPEHVVRAVDVLPGAEFRVGPPRFLGRTPDVIFDADADREWKHVIASVPAGKPSEATIRVVLDWESMLKQH